MKLDRYIKQDLEKTFNIKINREIFSKEIFFYQKTKSSKEKLNSRFGVLYPKEINNQSSFQIEKVFPFILNEKPKMLEHRLLITPYLSERELKFLTLFNIDSVITEKLQINTPLKVFDIPVLETKNIEKLNIEKLSYKRKTKEISGTNLFFDFGYGNYYFLIVLPYDSLEQSLKNLNFIGSYKVTKELIRRIFEVSAPKGYRIRFLFCDHAYHNNIGLVEHIKNINTDKILAVMNLQDTGLGNEKLITKNYRYLLDEYTQRKIIKIANKIGESIKSTVMDDFSNIDLIIKDIPIIWFYSFPNRYKTSLHYNFLPKIYTKKISYILFSIIKNLYRDI
ncbi:MAG: hypothetical protein GXO22_04065 [Aquificae bacterium]|nr:hypothetical protein [Aquificota bacterium]